MNLGERYYQLSLLGRVSFLEAVAPGALVVHTDSLHGQEAVHSNDGRVQSPVRAQGSGHHQNPLLPTSTMGWSGLSAWQHRTTGLQILPLAKRSGGPFVDLITLGRTQANDLNLADPSVSRFHAFFRWRLGEWYLCDAGSRNGTKVSGVALKARTEIRLQSGDPIQFGSVRANFYESDSLFDFLTQGDG